MMLSAVLVNGGGLLAQLAEHRTFNPLVVGSSPTEPTKSIAGQWFSGLCILRFRRGDQVGTTCAVLVFVQFTDSFQCVSRSMASNFAAHVDILGH